MRTNVTKALDDCIARVRSGETLESCLAAYPDVRADLEPLLHLALSVSAVPRVEPSDEFKKAARNRLVARIREESRELADARRARLPRIPVIAVGSAWETLTQAILGKSKVAVPAMIVMLVVAAAVLSPLVIKPLSPATATTSLSSVTLLNGSAEIRSLNSEKWQRATDGMTLITGSRIRTATDGHALLTFFDGSTLKLDPGAEIEIQQLERNGQSATIVMKQWVGRTWSRVNRMLDPGSRYEINTPTATAAVRGTLFVTEVDDKGSTLVSTTEGLVSVSARGEEVLLPPSQQSKVQAGAAPAQPTVVEPARNEFVVRVNGPAVASVVDPTGSSVGKLSDGSSFNQVPRAQSSSPEPGIQIITIPQPIAGEYSLVLRYVADGEVEFNAVGRSQGIAYRHAGTLEARKGTEWLVKLNLRAQDGTLVIDRVEEIQALRGKAPEKVTGIATIRGKAAQGGAPAKVPDLKNIQDTGKDRDDGKKNEVPRVPDVKSAPTTDRASDAGKVSDGGKPAESSTGTGNDKATGKAPDKTERADTAKDTNGDKKDAGAERDKDEGKRLDSSKGQTDGKGAGPDKTSDTAKGSDDGKRSDDGKGNTGNRGESNGNGSDSRKDSRGDAKDGDKGDSSKASPSGGTGSGGGMSGDSGKGSPGRGTDGGSGKSGGSNKESSDSKTDGGGSKGDSSKGSTGGGTSGSGGRGK